MNRRFACIVAAMSVAFVTHAAVPGDGAAQPGNPMVGTWTFTLPDGCTEKHTFLASGFMSGTSGMEYVEEKYEISAVADANGFYKLTGLTLKDTGGPDCGGSTEDHSGKEWSAYVRFSPDGSKYIACSQPNLQVCWGPYLRGGE